MKFLRNLTIVAILISLCISISACYVIESASMDEIIGTYELTQYYVDYPTDQDEYDANCIEELGWKAYLVITGTNRGWYVFKDNDTEPIAVEVALTYEYDQENPSNIAYVTFKDSRNLRRENLGVNFKRKDKVLNHTKSAINSGILKQSGETIKYKKIDDTADKSFAISKMGTNVTVYTYEEWMLSTVNF